MNPYILGTHRQKIFLPAKIAAIAAIFGLGLLLGFKLKPATLGGQAEIAGARQVREGGYELINPLLECELAENSFTELKPFKSKVEAYINQLNSQSNNIDFVSVYFRDLNNGPWFGINEKENFSPASLLKLPLMMAYLKQAESQPEILKKAFVFEDDGSLPNTTQTLLPSEVLEPGWAYSVDDLIFRMIVYSDNRAQHVLVANMDVGVFSKVYSDFGLNVPSKENPETLVSVKTYAGFFRMLFNASYLNKEYSKKALELLAQSEFRDGLVAGAPNEVKVAHKFGERQKAGESQRQLHDCGILYYPNHPYLLCVMSRGNSNAELAKIIKNTSKLVYEEVDAQFKDKK